MVQLLDLRIMFEHFMITDNPLIDSRAEKSRMGSFVPQCTGQNPSGMEAKLHSPHPVLKIQSKSQKMTGVHKVYSYLPK